MSTLYLHLPARALTDSSLRSVACDYVARGKRDSLLAHGTASLSELAQHIRAAQTVVLVLAAADVSVLRLAVPPLSGAKLRAALPNLLEDKLLGELDDAVIAASASQAGQRTLAVVQRDWLRAWLTTLRELGAQQLRAMPEQLCVPLANTSVSAALTTTATGISLALRSSEFAGLGLIVANRAAVLPCLRSLIATGAITLYVAPADLTHYQTLCADDRELQVLAKNATHYQPCPLNLAAELPELSGTHWQFKAWRVPLALAAGLLLVNIAALNFTWWQQAREATQLRSSLRTLYLNAYPKETVVLDPLLQMRQKIAAAQRAAGQLAPDDFTVLTAAFAEAWASVKPAENSQISELNYANQRLTITLKTALAIDAMRDALGARAMQLTSVDETHWQLGGAP
ncbi:MAG: type II secretion system protein GspL [Sideroxydans sp.]|nr:type II secretion system protein GspL [Sideroxydans sp.]